MSQEILELVSASDDGAFILDEWELKTSERHRSAEFITVRYGRLVDAGLLRSAVPEEQEGNAVEVLDVEDGTGRHVERTVVGDPWSASRAAQASMPARFASEGEMVEPAPPRVEARQLGVDVLHEGDDRARVRDPQDDGAAGVAIL
ncbi:MAG TPA: hypothetical protein VK975_03220 [Acidimicrobiales bacterium]|nr:hypothetical protein [Acidimicrobiales bacterium]